DLAPEDEAALLARRLVSVSAIATAAIGSGVVAGLAPSARRAVAVLVALEADPGALAAARGAASLRVVDAAAQELDVAPQRRPDTRAPRPHRETDSRSVLAAAEEASAARRHGAQPERQPVNGDAQTAEHVDDPGAPPEVRV